MRTKYEIILRDFTIADLLGQSIFAIIYVGEQTMAVQAGSNLRGILFL